MTQALTVNEKVLLSASEIDAEHGTFTAEDLIVRCWERFPDTFGLQGYAERFPDANRVLTTIMGGKGLRGKGWIRKVGEKRYHLTESGRQAASQLANPAANDTIRGAGLSREVVEILLRVIQSKALQKFRLKQELTFSDLSAFWNVSPRSNSHQLNVAIKDTSVALQVAETLLNQQAAQTLVLPGSPIPVTRADIGAAKSLQDHLKEKFWQDLEVIRDRSDERMRR